MKRRILFLTLPLLTLALALSTGSVLLLRVFSVMVLVPVSAWLWAVIGIRGLSSRARKSVEYCQAGECFDEEITVSSSSSLPKLLIQAAEKTDLPGYVNEATFNLPPRGNFRWKNSVFCHRRGLYSLGSLTATATDPFGLFSFHRDLGEPLDIVVFPATLDLPFFQSLSHRDQGYGTSRWLTSEVGPDAARVREYASGDTLNRVHWPSTAHTGKLMVKEFDPDRSNYASRNVWIVLDMHQDSQAGEGDNSTEEYGVTIAASLIKKYMDGDKQVGLMSTGDRPYFFPPQTGEPYLWNMMEALALIKASGGIPVERLILGGIDHFGTDTVMVVITPASGAKLLGPLRQVRSRGTPVIVISLDSSSFAGTAPATTTRNLVANGFQVYVVRSGEAPGKVLDSRAQIPLVRNR